VAEGGVAVAQFAADATDRALGHVTQLGLLGEALDIPIRQAAYVAADDQRLEWPGTHHGSGSWNHLTDKVLGGASHLGHGDADFAFGGLDCLWPCPIARTRCRWRALVASTAQEGGHFLVDRPLQHQACSQPPQLRQVLTSFA